MQANVAPIQSLRHSNVFLIAILACLSLQAWLAIVVEVNWDEFFFLSHVYNFQRGEMAKALQSFYVHLLGWVTSVPGDEIRQIQAGRLFMLVCFAGSCGLIFVLSRKFLSREASLVASLAYASAGFSIIHGASFRADPLATLFMMGSLVTLATGRMGLRSMVAGAALAAVGAMITVKVILFAPAFIGIGAWRIMEAEDRRKALFWLTGIGLSAAIFFALLYLSQLAMVPKATNSASHSIMKNAAEVQFTGGLIPRSVEVLRFVLLSPLQTMLIAGGIVSASMMLRSSSERPKAVAMLGCGATLLCLLIYRNAFPYFFPFILAPAVVLAGLAVDRISAVNRLVLPVGAGLVISAVMIANSWSNRDLKIQQQVVATVHHMFPAAVHYIDRNSMIASFPKRGFFMSTWGMQAYRRQGEPVFEQVLQKDVVPLLIANGPAFELALSNSNSSSSEFELIERDSQILRDNFIPHWGPIWVAGKSFPAMTEPAQFTILVPGHYKVEGANTSIDGVNLHNGQVVFLRRGQHSLNPSPTQPVTLRWGKNLPRPSIPFTGPIYHGF